MTQNSSLQKYLDESMNHYCYRLYRVKDEIGIGWSEIVELVNSEFGTDLSINAVQLRAYKYRPTEDDEEVEITSSDIDIEIKKELYKAADERRQANANIRRIAREETLKEIAHDFALQMKDAFPFGCINYKLSSPRFKNKTGILCISDIHYGLVIDSAYNKYDPEIAEERLNKLLGKVIEYSRKEQLKDICVVNLGDLIAGRIHSTIKFNSRIDVITQTMKISELLAEFLFKLSKYIKVSYTSTSDNHSRIEPIKAESLELESLVRITDWFIAERCKDFITILPKEFGDDLATFKIGKFNIIATHGDKDKPSNVIQNLRLFTGVEYDLCLMAHRHHFSADEVCGTVLIANGCLCGTDKFAQDLRLRSVPSQNFIIMSEDNPVECIYKINLE